jgi:hypothetical protein
VRSLSSLLLMLLLVSLAATSAARAQAAEPTVQSAQMEAAIEKLRADPNLSTTRKTRAPRWRSEQDDSQPRDWSWLEWVAELFRWIAEGTRVFVWVVIGLLLLLLVAYLARFFRALPKAPKARDAAPTHVRDLDIRPESLPADVGGAAWELWGRGEHRASLALLYRGLLSRLVHAYSTPIRSSSTEGECLQLARERLPQAPGEFAARLIRVWQRAVYGGREAQAEEVRELCEQFAVRMPEGAQG